MYKMVDVFTLFSKLKVGDEVFVLDSSSETWYGVCEDKCGYFDSRYVKLVKVLNRSVSCTEKTSVNALYIILMCDCY